MFISGKVSIVLEGKWFEPKTPTDVSTQEAALQTHIGWFAHPIYGDGDYPRVITDKIPRSQLFSDEEKKRVKGGNLFGLFCCC